ncbi:MAG: hypothetical protein ACKOC6_09080, partial [bacterium]
VLHRDRLALTDGEGHQVAHDEATVRRCFDEALTMLVSELTLGRDAGDERSLHEAARQSQAMIDHGLFDPV